VAGRAAPGGPATGTLADGGSRAQKAVVVAVEGPEAGRLLGPALAAAPSKPAAGVGTCCLYFAAPRPARWGAGLGGWMGQGDSGRATCPLSGLLWAWHCELSLVTWHAFSAAAATPAMPIASVVDFVLLCASCRHLAIPSLRHTTLPQELCYIYDNMRCPF